MTRRIKHSLLLALLVGSTVSAQALRSNKGPGIKLGSGVEGHVGVAFETAYDSNVFNIDDKNDGLVEGAPFIRVVPALSVTTLSPTREDGTPSGSRKVDFRLGAAFGIRKYISDVDAVNDLNQFDVLGDMALTLNPRGSVAFTVFDNFRREVSPRNTPTSDTFTRNVNQVGGTFRFQPGGRALSAALGYDYNLDILEEGDDFGFDPSSNHHRFHGGLQWRFLPKTSWLLEGEGRVYNKDEAAMPAAGLVDSTHARVYAGLVGLITPRISTTLKAGFGHANYDLRDDFNNFITVASLTWYAATTAKLTLGYERNFADSVFSNTALDDLIYLLYQHEIAQRFIVSLKPGFRHRKYRGLPTNASYVDTERNDSIFEFDGSLDIRTVDWLFVGMAYYLTMNTNDFTTTQDSFVGDTDSYQKHIIMGRLEASY